MQNTGGRTVAKQYTTRLRHGLNLANLLINGNYTLAHTKQHDRYYAMADLLRNVETETFRRGFSTFDRRGHTCFENLKLFFNVRWWTAL